MPKFPPFEAPLCQTFLLPDMLPWRWESGRSTDSHVHSAKFGCFGFFGFVCFDCCGFFAALLAIEQEP